MNKKFKNFFGSRSAEAATICLAIYEASMRGDTTIANELFADLCGIAKFKHIRILWAGNDRVRQPDKFTLVKNGREYLCNIDGIRFDGINATCRDNGRYI